jgi:subtilisin family serine protease
VGATERGLARRWLVLLALLLAPALAVGGAGGIAAAEGYGDPYRAEQWNLDRIRTDEAWTVTRGAGAVVAVVDTGVALDHPDLVDRLVRREDGSVLGLDLVDADGDAGDRHGHGTLVAGIVAATADDGHGIAGVAPEARILPVRVLDEDGAGRSEDVGRAIRWAVDHGADVVNVSLEAVAGSDGARGAPGVPDDAVRYADQRGVLVVAAAGNEPGAAASYPESSPIVLVGAVDRDDRAPAFSVVDRPDGFVAPGVGIVSTWCQRTAGGCDVAAAPYGVAEGTSFAAPHVSGVAALLAATGLDAAAIRERLAAGAVDLGEPGPDRVHGTGRVDAAASLGLGAAAGRSAPSSPAPPAEARPDPAPPAPVDPPAPTEPAPEPDGADLEDEPALVDPADVPPPEPATDDAATLVSLEAQGADPAAGSEPLGGGPWLELLAAGLVALTMGAWSAAARTYV